MANQTIYVADIEDLATIVAGLVKHGITFEVCTKTSAGCYVIEITGY